jgi:hypothetical protein
MAQRYRQRSAAAANWTAFYFPLLMTLLVCGTITLLQGLAVFGPLIQLLYELGRAT